MRDGGEGLCKRSHAQVNTLARPWVRAKGVILELLRRLSVRGGKGTVFEFTRPGDQGYPRRRAG